MGILEVFLGAGIAAAAILLFGPPFFLLLFKTCGFIGRYYNRYLRLWERVFNRW